MHAPWGLAGRFGDAVVATTECLRSQHRTGSESIRPRCFEPVRPVILTDRCGAATGAATDMNVIALLNAVPLEEACPTR
jgi:hypothetical protein